jgi:ArsR family transcriptional regulator
MRVKHFPVAFGQQLFKALGDESRVRILHLLWRNQEMVVSKCLILRKLKRRAS